MSPSDRVLIGMDPHKRSATIEVMTGDETVLGAGRFGTDRAGHTAMVAYAKQWPNRVWAALGVVIAAGAGTVRPATHR